MLATPSGVSRAASSAFSCRCAVPGYQTGRSDYTRGQSPETGSLSRHLAVWEPLPSMSHRVLPAGFGFTSLVFLGDDAGLRTVTSIGDFGWCSPGAHCPGLMRVGPAGEERRTPRYTVPVSPQCPQEIGLPTLPVFQGAAVSSEHTSQSLPPGNVAEPRCSPPLRGSLQQLVRLSPAGVPFQDTKLAALITPEASLERLVPLVDYLAAWKLLLSVSPWVLHTVERLQNPDGFSSASIQRGESHFGGPRAGSGNGTRSRILSWERRPPRWSLLTKASPGSTAGTS